MDGGGQRRLYLPRVHQMQYARLLVHAEHCGVDAERRLDEVARAETVPAQCLVRVQWCRRIGTG